MNDTRNIVLLDGECLLCQRSFQFIIRNDKKNIFQFGFLQDAKIQHDLMKLQLTKPIPDSLILIEQDEIYFESTAVLRIAGKLKFPSNLLRLFLFIPAFLRDAAYRYIAKKRFHWFGRSDACLVPDESLNKRIVRSLENSN